MELEKDLKKLKILLDNNQVYDVKKLLEKLVKLYKSNSKIVDHFYTEKSSLDKLKFDLSDDANKKEDENSKKVRKIINLI